MEVDEETREILQKDFVAKQAALANERCTESGFGPGLGPSWPRYAAVCLTIQ